MENGKLPDICLIKPNQRDNLNIIQALVLGEQLSLIEDSAKKFEEKQRKQYNQFALKAFNIDTFIILFFYLAVVLSLPKNGFLF
jgi:hypothetical protein